MREYMPGRCTGAGSTKVIKMTGWTLKTIGLDPKHRAEPTKV